jgi:hypothetical protein
MATTWTKLSLLADFGGAIPSPPKIQIEMENADPLPDAGYQGGFVIGADMTVDPPDREDQEDTVCFPTDIPPTAQEILDVKTVTSAHVPEAPIVVVGGGNPKFAFPPNLKVDRAKGGEDWAVGGEPQEKDDPISGKPGKVFRLDDTEEQGFGFKSRQRVPVGSTSVVLFVPAAPKDAQPGQRTVAFKAYFKEFAPGIARLGSGSGWSAGYQLADFTLEANTDWVYFEQEVTLAALGITAGSMIRIELTRVAPVAGTPLPGDLDVMEEGFTVRFI